MIPSIYPVFMAALAAIYFIHSASVDIANEYVKYENISLFSC